MNTSINLKKHISITSSNDIAQIVKPLKTFLGIEHFSFRRIYEDQSRFYLCSVPEWAQHSLQRGYLKRGRFNHLSIANNLKYVLWDYWPENDILFAELMKDSRENFDQDHGFSILRENLQHVDAYTFTTKKINSHINNLYFNNINPLENFIDYFMSKLSPIIKKAEEQKIFLSKKEQRDLFSNSEYERQEHLKVDKFYKDLQQNKDISFFAREGAEDFHTIEQLYTVLSLSPRQKECLFYLIRGQTAKQIAQKLGCSYRTIETHLAHIKSKFKCATKGQLIEIAIQNGFADTALDEISKNTYVT